MKEPLKVGDRVRVFSHYGPYDGTVTAVDVEGNTPRGFVKGLLRVRNSEGNEWYQHPRQCVRLRRKPRAERARVERWVNIYSHGPNLVAHPKKKDADFHAGDGRISTAHLFELREGEAIISREQLAKAWDSEDEVSKSGYAMSETSNAFKALCKALGFDKEKK